MNATNYAEEIFSTYTGEWRTRPRTTYKPFALPASGRLSLSASTTRNLVMVLHGENSAAASLTIPMQEGPHIGLWPTYERCVADLGDMSIENQLLTRDDVLQLFQRVVTLEFPQIISATPAEPEEKAEPDLPPIKRLPSLVGEVRKLRKLKLYKELFD